MHEPVTKRRPMIDMEEFERRLRRQSSGNRTEDDPLAELARIINGQQDSSQRVAEPQGQSSTEAREVARSSSEAQETQAQGPDAVQSLDDDNTASRDSSNVNKEIAAIMIMAAIIIVGIVGIEASVGYRSGASPPPEIATISENGPAKLQIEKTNRSGTPDASVLGAAPQPSPGTVVDNIEQPVDPLQPRETMPAAGIAASPEQIETRIEPSSQTAPIAPEKMNTASVERHDALLSSDMPLRATAKVVPLPVPRPAAVAKASAPKTAARVATPRSDVGAEFRRGQSLPIANTARPKGEPDALGNLLRGLFGNVREP